MNRRVLPALIAALALSACTSIRVSGFVLDKTTGDGIGACGIMLGRNYVHTDPAGHFSIKADYRDKMMSLTAPGYVPLTVPIDASETRYPIVEIKLVPKKNRSVATAGE